MLYAVRVRLTATLVLVCCSVSALAQTPTIEDFAGGARVLDRPGTEFAVLPLNLATGPDGRIYIHEGGTGLGKIRRFDPPTGTVTGMPAAPHLRDINLISSQGIEFASDGGLYAVSGSVIWRYDLETGERTQIAGYPLVFVGNTISDIAIDAAGNLFVVDEGAHVVRVMRPDGQVEIFAGRPDSPSFTGDGGPAVDAFLNRPHSVVADGIGNVYISDTGNHVIRRVGSNGVISRVVGTGSSTFNGDGLPGLSTNIGPPGELAVLPDGSIAFADGINLRVRRFVPDSNLVYSIAGNGTHDYLGDGNALEAGISSISGIASDAAGNVYLASSFNKRLLRVSAGTITTVAGNGTVEFCGDGRIALEACFDGPTAVTVDASDNAYLGDTYNGRVRRIDSVSTQVSTVVGKGAQAPFAGMGGPATDASLGGQARGVAFDPEGNLHVVVNQPSRVLRINSQSGVVTVFAGTGVHGFSGDGDAATSAQLNLPHSIAFDSAGNAYISDSGNHRIRKVAAGTGVISTIAGSGLTTGSLNDGGSAMFASLFSPGGLAIDPSGALVISDELHCRVRRVDLTTGIITSIAGDGGCFPGPVDVSASTSRTGRVLAIAYSPAGELYMSTDTTIRRIDRDGIVRAVVGDGAPLLNPSGRGVANTYGLAFDSAGRLYLTSFFPDGMRRISGLPQPPVSDATPPLVTANVAGPAGQQGWYLGNTHVSWNVSDPESEVTSTDGCGVTSVLEDTAGVTVTCSATSAGGTTTQSTVVRRDATPPQVAWTTPADGVRYGAFSTLVAQFSCSESTSGISVCSGTHPSGTALATNVAGNFNFYVSAVDNAGNSTFVSRTFSVAPLQFERFIEPLRRSPTFNGVTAGSLVPIRWRMLDGTGQAVTNPAAFQSLTVLNLTCQGTAVPLNDTATGGAGLTVNPANGYFTYNWQTEASWAGTCRRVQIRLGDNSVREVVFRLQ
jgi:sugar lactone lactonase YvrE